MDIEGAEEESEYNDDWEQRNRDARVDYGMELEDIESNNLYKMEVVDCD